MAENIDLNTKKSQEHDLQNNFELVKKQNANLQNLVETLTEELKTTKNESEQKYNKLIENVANLTKKVNSSLSGNEEYVKNISDSIDSISKQLCNERIKTTDLDLKFQLHENSTHDGHMIWKINDFENRTNDAVIGKIRALHSAPCFTAKYGYKFCLRLYLHGDGMGRGTHLSLFLVIMKSEYDDILKWPFQKKIKFKLINQEDRSKDHMEQIFSNKDSSSFQKPEKEMNIASGCPLFVPLARLEPDGFLRNGNIFIEVKIE